MTIKRRDLLTGGAGIAAGMAAAGLPRRRRLRRNPPSSGTAKPTSS